MTKNLFSKKKLFFNDRSENSKKKFENYYLKQKVKNKKKIKKYVLD